MEVRRGRDAGHPPSGGDRSEGYGETSVRAGAQGHPGEDRGGSGRRGGQGERADGADAEGHAGAGQKASGEPYQRRPQLRGVQGRGGEQAGIHPGHVVRRRGLRAEDQGEFINA